MSNKTPNKSKQSLDSPIAHTALSDNEIEKKYKCELCEYSTASLRAFKYHYLIHNKKAKIYQCKFCSFVTRHWNVNYAHKITHMNDDEVTWYECETCTFKTKLKANLFVHGLTHKKDEMKR